MKLFLFITLAILNSPAVSAVLTFNFEARLDEAFGSLPANSVLSGSFSYESVQSGTVVTNFNNMMSFELLDLNLSDGSETIDLGNLVPGLNDAWSVVGDDSPAITGEDFFTVRAEGSPFAGTIGGLSIYSLYLVWTDTDGVANNGLLLPQGQATFNEYDSAVFQINADNLTSAQGTITNVSLVPVPAAAWLFFSGLLGLLGMTGIKKSV